MPSTRYADPYAAYVDRTNPLPRTIDDNAIAAAQASVTSDPDGFGQVGHPDPTPADGDLKIADDSAAATLADGATATGKDDTVTATGPGSTIRFSGTGEIATLSDGTGDLLGGDDAQVTGDRNAITMATQTSVTLHGDANNVAISGSGGTIDDTGTGITLSGTGNTLTLAGTGSNVTLAGSGNTVKLGGSGTIAAQAGNETLAVTSKAATATITGFAATDTLRFSASQFTGWQDFLAHASQQGADTVIDTDAAHSITLAGVTLATLTPGEVAFA